MISMDIKLRVAVMHRIDTCEAARQGRSRSRTPSSRPLHVQESDRSYQAHRRRSVAWPCWCWWWPASRCSRWPDANERLDRLCERGQCPRALARRSAHAVDRRAIAARNLVLVTKPEDIAAEKAAVLSGPCGRAVAPGRPGRPRDRRNAPGDKARELVAEMIRVEALYGPVALDIVKDALDGRKEEAAGKISDNAVRCWPS